MVRRREDLGVVGEVPSSWIIVEFPKQVHLQKDVAAMRVLVRIECDVELEWVAYKLRERCL